MKKLLLIVSYAMAALAANAQTIVINDSFDDGNLTTNTTGTGTGFASLGSVPVTESSGQMNLSSTENSAQVHLAESHDVVNPFQAQSTTLRFRFSELHRDPNGQILRVGYRIASNDSQQFDSSVKGLHIEILERDSTNPTNPEPRGYLVLSNGTSSAGLANWTWGAGTDLSNLSIELTTNGDTWSISFSVAPSYYTRSMYQPDLSAFLDESVDDYEVVAYHQYWGASSEGGAALDFVTVSMGDAPEIVVEAPASTPLVSGSSTVDLGDQRQGTPSSAMTFVVRNTGTAALSISSVSSSNPAFLINDSSLSGSVASGASTSFQVNFTPNAQGASSSTITINSNDSDEGSFTTTVIGNGINPEINVSGRNSIPISNADASPSALDGTMIGEVSLAGTISQVYTISNTGTAPLLLTGSTVVEISGPDAANFNVVSEPNSPLAVSEISTFEIEFTSSKLGVHEAIVTIASDDVNAPSFTFAIQGIGITPSVFEYSAEGYNVKQGSTSVTLVVNRVSGTSATTIKITTIDGDAAVNRVSYEAALAGVDYETKDETLSFAENEVSKSVEVTLIPRATEQPHRRFFCILSDVAAGNSISREWAVVRIFSYTNPVVSIATPNAKTSSVSSIAPYTIAGTVRDYELFGIDRVEVSLNGTPVGNAQLGSGTTFVPWSMAITPSSGSSNTIAVKAFDNFGFESAVATRTFTFTQRYQLGVVRAAPAGIGLDAAGLVVPTVTPSTSLSLVTAANAVNASPRIYGVLPGAVVRLTAVPKAGYSFSHWEGLPGGAIPSGNTFSFTMPNTDVSGVTAHFVVNPFSGPAGSSNVFYSHVRPAISGQYGNASLGFVTGTLVPSSGVFSGSIRIGGVTQAFAGSFFGDGSYLFTVGTTRSSSLSFTGGRTLSLSYSLIDKTITATVVQSGITSSGILQRGIYSSTNRVPNSLLNESSITSGPLVRGFYTAALLPKTQSLSPTVYPQGAGYGSVTLSNMGTVLFTGVLADGTAFTASGGLIPGDNAPFFAQLLTPGGARTNLGGSFGGILAFDVGQSATDVTATDILWTRPTVTAQAGNTAAAAATRLYTSGWPSGITVDAVGALYSKTTTIQASLDLDVPNSSTGNGELLFSAGRLSAPVSVTQFNVSGSAVAKIPATNPAFTLAVSATTGGFSGVFTPNWSPLAVAKPIFRGIVVAKGTSKRGYGYFISNVNNTSAQESGMVRLGRP